MRITEFTKIPYRTVRKDLTTTEVVLGIPLILIALAWAPDRWQGLLLIASVLQVWLIELINSAIEALADAVSGEIHPLLVGTCI